MNSDGGDDVGTLQLPQSLKVIASLLKTPLQRQLQHSHTRGGH